jgi:DNA-binding transcriptional LysR family regulator
MDRFQSLIAFARVVEAGSFARAADRLDVSVSAVSRQVSDLESHLGVRLLNRTTRRLSMTESGQAFYERCVQLLADLDEAEEAVSASAVVPRGTLRITASISFGAGYLAPAIAALQQRHPQLRFDIELSDRAVDLVDERIDLAIRIGDIGSQALISRRIGIAQMVCCAAPAYLAKHEAPRTPADLASHACLTYEYSSGGNLWRFTDATNHAHEVSVSGIAHANNGAMLAALAVAGVGVALEPDFIVAPDARDDSCGCCAISSRQPSASTPPIRAGGTRRRKCAAFIDFLAARLSAIRGGGLPTTRRAAARTGAHAQGRRSLAPAHGIWIFRPGRAAGTERRACGRSTIDDDALAPPGFSRIARSVPTFVASG